jgi:Amt family ammonium transporter
MIQLIAAGVTFVYSGVVTFVILAIIKATIGIRVENEDEIKGLDETQHGETAYFFL